MAERGDAIVLIGFMGSGKSAAGERLARRTGWPCSDTDQMIAESFGMPITEVFDTHGEAIFRHREAEIVAALPLRRAVIVTGGGVILRDDNVEALRRLGTVVNLIADEETLFERVARRNTRPLLRSDNPRSTLSDLLRVRAPLYRAAADFEVDTSALTRAEVAQAILSRIESSCAHAS